ncbi:hypothetical protein [Erythrobacter sp.]|uniref:hypothetical protein n=1 Tax=Erythrobacter sp. TaxID=1042 RepID=UPI0025E0ECCB|nr:hypothetical protein [Erythrobacter sp.]
MISELGKIECVSRIIAVCANRGLTPASGIVLQEIGLQFEQLYLWTLSRAQIRELTESFFDTDDFEMTSLVTQKVYDDLLGLCIPLTPNNVIMYMKILFVDGNFIPINRVDILQKFLMDSLRRPSDSFTGSFNYRNKIDIIAEFSKLLLREERGYFTQKDWLNFCDEFKARTLLGFNSNSILDEILEARIFARSGERIFFRYGFFYSFALGSALNSDQGALDEFLQDRNYTSVSDVLDVVTALNPNSDRIIDALGSDLVRALQEFQEQVVKENFDPLLDALWASNDKEDEQTWQPIAKAISEGPEKPEKIDSLKSSYLAEARTADQEVTIKKFHEIEYNLVIIKKNLVEVLKNVNDVDRDKKVSAYESLLKAELCSFQVGTVFAPELAQSRFYRWGAIAFLDFNKAAKDLNPVSAEAISNVVVSLSRSVAIKSRQDLAFQKLGGIFADRALRTVSVGYLEVLNFYHLIGGRAEGWEKAAEHLLEKASPGSLYLLIMLRGILDELKHDVVRIGDRSKLKRLVAYTRAKRMYVVSKPSDQQIANFIQKMSKEELIA